ncbi:MAG: pilus assembly protein PilP [Burkholderiaceae bacterium]
MKIWRYSLMLGLIVGLSACGAYRENELREWMAQQKKLTKPNVKPIAEPKQFKPETYQQANALEPFSKDKLSQALKREMSLNSASGRLIAPELARRKEALESFPLDAMSLVGGMVRAGQPVALLKVDKLLYQVRPGNYLGQNYGRVTKITETEITLREIVQDAAGEWIERPATLQLQERLK